MPAARAAGARRDPEPATARCSSRTTTSRCCCRSPAAARQQPESAGDLKAHRGQRHRASEGRPVGADRAREGHRAGAGRPPRHRSITSALLAKAHRHLLSMAQMRHKAVIVNRMQLPSNTVGAYRVLACPVLRADGAPWACWRCSAAESRPNSRRTHARLTELLARRVATIIAHSYDALTGLLTRPALEQRVGRRFQEVSRQARSAAGAHCRSTSIACTSSTTTTACTWAIA
jgi:hypothetical protein